MVEKSIIAHQQNKIEELEFTISILQAEIVAKEHAIDVLHENLFWCIVNKKFDENLSLAREECQLNAELNDDIEYSEREAWNAAVEWTQEDIGSDIGHELENRWQQHQEATNKEHYG